MNLRCPKCGRENMAISDSEHPPDIVQCMSCGREVLYDSAERAYAEVHFKDTSGSGKPDAHRDMQAWKLKRP
jgi:endogenous inhibitor of DNA gyrase (YacG/DUF329 family)